MIEFSFQTSFQLDNTSQLTQWCKALASHHHAIIEQVGFVFCDDAYVHEINRKHLNHDTYTDIITFDYGTEDRLEGEIYISVDRVKDNAEQFEVPFNEELKRVMAHGLLHMLGYDDHTADQKSKMRGLENEALEMFHVKQ